MKPKQVFKQAYILGGWNAEGQIGITQKEVELYETCYKLLR